MKPSVVQITQYIYKSPMQLCSPAGVSLFREALYPSLNNEANILVWIKFLTTVSQELNCFSLFKLESLNNKLVEQITCTNIKFIT